MSDYEGTKYHDVVLVPDKGRVKVWAALTEYLQKYIPRGATVLDLAAGYCDFINLIKAKKKYAIDLSDIVKKAARKNVTAIVGDCRKITAYKIDKCDVIFASNFFEHLTKDDFAKTLKEIKKQLKPSGKLIIMQPNYKHSYKDYFDDYTHEVAWSDISLPEFLVAHGFKVTKCIPKFMPHTMKSRLPKSKFLTTLYLHSPIKPLGGQMLIIARP